MEYGFDVTFRMHPYRTPAEMPKTRWGVTKWKKLYVRIHNCFYPREWRQMIRTLERIDKGVAEAKVQMLVLSRMLDDIKYDLFGADRD